MFPYVCSNYDRAVIRINSCHFKVPFMFCSVCLLSYFCVHPMYMHRGLSDWPCLSVDTKTVNSQNTGVHGRAINITSFALRVGNYIR